MKNFKVFIFLILFFTLSCNEVLDPKPENLLTEDIALSVPSDVENARIGLYKSFREIAAPTVIAGDVTADMATFRGTFTQYLELANKQITSSNSVVSSLWQAIYNTVYVSNFILERLPEVKGVQADIRKNVMATARFLRGLAYFIGTYTYGSMPLVTTTDIEANKTIAPSSQEQILTFVLEDYLAALPDIEEQPLNAGFAGVEAVKAALARYHLYGNNWSEAEKYASQIIAKRGEDTITTSFKDVVFKDFSSEAIFEVGYAIVDDPGTASEGLNNIFVGRREIIPTNEIVQLFLSRKAGNRIQTLSFDSKLQQGSDNGWTVRKHGSKDDDNNNISIFRLGEMFLIRAEARARLGKLNGNGSVEKDINVLRHRAVADSITTISSQAEALSIVEDERLMELAYEGHRWYDLKRTGRLNQVMREFSDNWKDYYNLWPVPLREIQNNPSLRNAQNPGY